MEDNVIRFYEQYDEHRRLLRDPFHLTEFLISKAIIKKYVEKFFNHKELKVLDIGGGTGRYSVWFGKTFPKAQIYLIDLVPKHIETAKEYIKKFGLEDKIEAKVRDIRNIDFPDNYFDVILCLGGVLNHLPKNDVDRALENLKKFVKNNGLIFVSIITSTHLPFLVLRKYPEEIDRLLDALKEKEFPNESFKVFYNPFKFKRKLERYFKVLEVSALEGYSSGNPDKFNEICKTKNTLENWLSILWRIRKLRSSIYNSDHVMYVCQKI